MRLRATFAGLAVAAVGVAALAAITDGFRTATTDGAWRLAVAARPRVIPDVTLVDQTGATFRLSALRGRPVLVAFFYTNCPAICGLLAGQFQLMLDALFERSGGREVRLLSISFDTARDNVAALADYAERLGADGRTWRVARVVDLRAGGPAQRFRCRRASRRRRRVRAQRGELQGGRRRQAHARL